MASASDVRRNTRIHCDDP